ncbi:MAG: aminopeptidase P family protein, partial [Chloroflexi bacterium]|nr:aminopeptidase P family protein [Chloroflexota bacterium]
MKTDLDALMQTYGIEALLVTGPAQYNPFMVYMTGGGHLTMADLIKKRGEAPLLFYAPMERDEAARTGLRTRGYNEYPLHQLMKEAHGDRLEAMALRYQHMLLDAGVTSGKVALYGRVEIGPLYSVLNILQQKMPGLTLCGFQAEDILQIAMATKETEEIERIRRMGKITTQVVGQVADFLSGQAVRNDVLVKKDGEALTLGEVKGRINAWLAEQGADNPEGTIFAIGRDAGVPHSSGKPDDLLRLGETIVFDIYPCEAQGGYYYDFTRTWCLGYAPDAAQALYDDVYAVYRQVVSELKPGTPFTHYQNRTCELFRAQGHATIAEAPQTEEGYVHSLGHGVGLRIHERPFCGTTATERDMLQPGAVFTIEPGLYYPSKGLGVRLEDTYHI